MLGLVFESISLLIDYSASAIAGAIAGSIIPDIIDGVIKDLRRRAGRAVIAGILNVSMTPLYEYFTFDRFIETFVGKDILRRLINTPSWQEANLRASNFVNNLKELNRHITTLATEIDSIEPGMGRIIVDHWYNILWSVGIGWLSWATMSPVVSRLIADKIEEAINEAFTPRDLTPAQLIRLFLRDEISYEELKERMLKHGYSEYNTMLLVKYAQRLPTLSQLQDALKYNIIDREQFIAYLKKLGYTQDAVNIIYKLTKVKKLEPEKDLTKSEILRLYEIGAIDYNTALRLLEKLGYDEEEAKLLLRLADYTKFKTIEGNTYSRIKRYYLDGVIDKEEAIRLLRLLGFSEIAIQRAIKDWDK